jgi:osmotically-inducible protein OsmY
MPTRREDYSSRRTRRWGQQPEFFDDGPDPDNGIDEQPDYSHAASGNKQRRDQGIRQQHAGYSEMEDRDRSGGRFGRQESGYQGQQTYQWEQEAAGKDRQDWQATQRGRFSGRGPKGYRRSDERIQEEINEILTRHGDIDATDIEVRVQQGEVTLTGTVDDRWAKRLAEDIAEDVVGVTDVQNQIRVRRASESQGSEERTARSSAKRDNG